jgi:hypothetical protein
MALVQVPLLTFCGCELQRRQAWPVRRICCPPMAVLRGYLYISGNVFPCLTAFLSAFQKSHPHSCLVPFALFHHGYESCKWVELAHAVSAFDDRRGLIDCQMWVQTSLYFMHFGEPGGNDQLSSRAIRSSFAANLGLRVSPRKRGAWHSFHRHAGIGFTNCNSQDTPSG